MLAQEEDHQNAGAGMGADDAAHIAGHYVFHLGALGPAELFQRRGVLGTVVEPNEQTTWLWPQAY